MYSGKKLIVIFCPKIKKLQSFRRGARPEKHQDAAGGIIRAILITLDELQFTEKTENGGRRVTKIGQQALDLIAGQIANDEL